MSWLDRIFKRDQSKEHTGQGQAAPDSTPATPLPKPPPDGTALRGNGVIPQRAMTPDGPLTVPRFEVGERIADAYLVKRIIEGGMATVYLTHHDRWNLDLVVKAPKAAILADPEHAHRITREAEAWTDLGLHPHIAYCYYVHPLDGVPLLVIEYMDGGNLREWISEGRCADLKVGLDLAIQACHGLEHAHAKGMIHRDIKPENILLAQDGTLKLTDFGIVRVGDAKADGTSSTVQARAAVGMTVYGIGTEDYMAPEQSTDAHRVDARADIFSLGVCFYEMFCGGRPYPGKAIGSRQEAPEPRALRGDNALPEKLCALLRQCVDWDPGQRPTTAAAVRQALRTIYEERFQQPSARADLPDMSLKADELNNRGVTYLVLGREEEAVKCWQEALKEDPAHLEATFNSGYRQWQKGEIPDDVYVAQMRGLEDSKGEEPAYWRCLAWIHLERGDVDAVEKIQHSAYKVEEEAFKKAAEDPQRPVGRLVRTFTGHTYSVTSVSFSPDGRSVVSGSPGDDDEMLQLWEVGSGRWVRSFDWHTYGVTSVSFSPDGRSVVSGSGDNILRLWEVESGREVRCLKGHTDSVASVSFSPDGRSVVSGSHDHTVRLWEVESGREVRSFAGHTEWVNSVSFSPDGRSVVSGSDDHTVRLWEVESGREVRSFAGDTKWVNSVSFSPDGRYVVSGSRDHTVRLWEIDWEWEFDE